MRNLLLLSIVVLFLSAVADASEKSVVKCEGPVKAAVGDDVIFPCSLEPPYNMRPARVEWKRGTALVHRYRSGGDDNNDQEESYKDRTFMFETELDKGNISLRLTNVKKEDEGHYTCRVPTLYTENYINFSVYLSVDLKNSSRKGTDHWANSGIIAGSVVGSVFFIVLIGIIVKYRERLTGWICRRQSQRDAPRPSSVHSASSQEERGNKMSLLPVPEGGEQHGADIVHDTG